MHNSLRKNEGVRDAFGTFRARGRLGARSSAARQEKRRCWGASTPGTRAELGCARPEQCDPESGGTGSGRNKPERLTAPEDEDGDTSGGEAGRSSGRRAPGRGSGDDPSRWTIPGRALSCFLNSVLSPAPQGDEGRKFRRAPDQPHDRELAGRQRATAKRTPKDISAPERRKPECRDLKPLEGAEPLGLRPRSPGILQVGGPFKNPTTSCRRLKPSCGPSPRVSTHAPVSAPRLQS